MQTSGHEGGGVQAVEEEEEGEEEEEEEGQEIKNEVRRAKSIE